MNNSEFKCLKCGDCCRWPGYVRISQEEAEAIAEYLGMEIYDFVSKMTQIAPDKRSLALIDKDENNPACIFFSESPPACKIYPVRPTQCRDFPKKWRNRAEEFQCRALRNSQA